MPKILYKFASRNRPEKFFKAVDNIIEMSRSDDYMIMATLDIDDPTMANAVVRDKINSYGSKLKAYYGTSKSKVDAINRDMDLAPDADILIVMSDDMEFIVPGFDYRIINDMGRSVNPLALHYNDGSPNGEKIMTLTIINRAYYQWQGYVYYPEYLSLYCDEEQTREAKTANFYKYFPDILFRHQHHLFMGTEKDSLHERNESPQVWDHDRRLYLKRNPTLLIKYATRGRKKLFYRAIENIYETIGTKYFKVIVSADENDPVMNSDDVRQYLFGLNNVRIYYGPHVSKVHAINRDMQWDKEWSWLVNMSDDMEFVQYDWDWKMYGEIINHFGRGNLDWFAHFNDGYVAEKLPTMAVMGYEYWERFGYIYHPSYNSVSCDAEQMFVAMMLGKHKYFPEIYFTHEHPANTAKVSDEIIRMNDKFGPGDTENYFVRRERLFDVENPVMIPYNPNVRE